MANDEQRSREPATGAARPPEQRSREPTSCAGRLPPRSWRVALVAALLAIAAPAAAAAAPSPAARSAGAWRDVAGRPAATHNGARPEVSPRRFRALALDRAALAGVLAGAPRERATPTLELSLPAPDGSFERFAVRRSSVMEPGLAAKHPEIATYAGSGIDEPGATVHLDLTALGFHASVRGPGGSWYVDPYHHRDESLYASYRGADLADPHGRFRELEPLGAAARPTAAGRGARAGEAVALRTYRLALVSDPGYAAYHGAANVTSAKATLVDRVNQVYEDDLAIHLSLVASNDLVNLDTAAQMTGANGPCGAAACYTTAQAGGCEVPTLDRTRVVLGQLIGASNYDVGHIGMGSDDNGGVAYLGVAGGDLKGGGCTGVSTPVGDLFAVDYVAHELGHQFGGNHTFDGTDGNCFGNASGAAVEPGSGVTVMAYAGICASDDLQPHSDPYFSQRSIDELGGYAGAAADPVDEVQTVSLRDFSGSDSFRLTYGGAQSVAIVRGPSYTASAISAAIRTIPGFPAGASATVRSWDGTAATPTDSGFSVRFGGSLANTDVAPLGLTAPNGTTGFVGETAQGGPSRNGGSVTTPGNHAPIVDAPSAFTIPTRTPFSLTGSATDADGDTLTYLWEQNDAGGGTSLVSNAKTSGPLLRVFGTAAAVSAPDTLLSPSPGENAAGTDPTRTFPDLAQVAAGTTNAATGTCPTAGDPVAPAIVDCYSEFLPTAAYASALHFRLTARDGHAGAGGVGHDDTTLTLARTAGPFRVTSQATPSTIEAGAPVTVTWSVAGTSAPPVSVASVRITMSTDGGLTFAKLVKRSTPNDGSQVVFLPNADTTHARIRVEAIGNVFFDVNRADLTILPGAPVVTDDAPGGVVTGQYSDQPAAVVISATDENTPGSALTGSAAGLPLGMTLVPADPPGGAIPGSRAFGIGGTILAAPGTYPVEVSVADDAGHVGLTFLDVVVTPEDAFATYTGDTLVTGAAGATQAPATLRFTVLDGAAAPAATDISPGDVANATVTFLDGATTLCAAVPVVTAGNATSGSATCTVGLAAGATHHIDAVVGGHYAGSGAGDVRIDATPADTTPPAAPPPPAPPGPPAPLPPGPPPPAAPSTAVLTPDLTRVSARLRVSSTGRVSLRLRCRTLGTGTPPSRCAGSVRLAARIGGVKRTIATGRFSFPRATARTVRLRLTARGRTATRTARRAATLTMTVPSAGGATRRATRSVTLLPPARS